MELGKKFIKEEKVSKTFKDGTAKNKERIFDDKLQLAMESRVNILLSTSFLRKKLTRFCEQICELADFSSFILD
jgi:hypothetical protein